MASISVYHGTAHQFERPDPKYFGEGDGQSVHGLGFYVAKYPEYAKEHLTDRIRNGAAKGGVIYEMDLEIDDKRIFDRTSPLKPTDMDRYIESARQQGKVDLANNISELKKHISSGAETTFQGRYVPVQDGTLGASRFQDFLEHHEGQTGASNFLKHSGIDALYTPNSQYSMYTVLNMESLKGNTRIHETIGDGPLRNNPAKLVENKDFWSQELSSADSDISASGNNDLRRKFDSLTAHLLSDEYSKRGLGPDAVSSRRQNDGYTLRDHLGNATQRLMRDGGMDEGHWGGKQSWDRFVKEAEYLAGDDPALMRKIQNFGSALETHNEKIHGLNASEKSLTKSFGKAAEFTGDLARKSGPVLGVVLGVGAAGATYLSTGSSAEAAEVAYETIVPYGETQIDVARGDAGAAAKSATVETASIGAAAAGAAGGFVVAGPIGAAVGGIAGGLGGGMAVEALLEPVALNEIPADEAQKRLSGLSPEMAEMMSPETQSLYVLKGHPDKFKKQYDELVNTGSIGEVSGDLGRIIQPDDAANSIAAGLGINRKPTMAMTM